MRTVSMSGSLRGNVGKKDAKSLRNEGKVPCVLYGGQEQIHFSMTQLAFRQILFTPETFVIELNIDGKVYQSILKDVQYHPVGDHVLHADFYEINESEPVVVSLPVRLLGTAPGVIRGGRLISKLSHIKVKGLVNKLPQYIEVSIAKMDIGSTIKIKDLKVDELNILDSPNSLIVAVKTARTAVADEEEDEEEGEEGGEEGGEETAEEAAE